MSGKRRKELDRKWEKLQGILKDLGSVVVAFSAGVDSTFLLHAAVKVLASEKTLAVTSHSVIHPARDLERAKTLAREMGVRHLVLEGNELEYPEFRKNPPERCYICKKELFNRLKELAAAEGFEHVAEGSNTGDLGDYRPGMRALKELGIRSPLLEAGLAKQDIRALSKEAGLPTWNRPSAACLASRVPYGTEITAEGLARVDEGESFLAELGLAGPVRVRHHETVVRLEMDPEGFPSLISEELRARVVKKFKSLGYGYVALDLEGYRTGSLNEELENRK
ncbi:MAG: ATP-dependent sacrificial sulfur transferase LarE [Gemmatimonadota bacterium]|nr:ATP-dependent sacrificial sulfur transferase LarE [Gemmatimonadota bacterium]